jgi:hypothetical protein
MPLRQLGVIARVDYLSFSDVGQQFSSTYSTGDGVLHGLDERQLIRAVPRRKTNFSAPRAMQ